MTLVHTAAHSVSMPDRFEDDETGVGFDVFQDTDADDPRTWVPDEHAAIYVYNGPRGHKDSEVPDNVVVQAFARFNETLPSDDHAFAATVRWLNIFHPDRKVDLVMQTIRGYSQGDWQDVFAVVGDGYGTAESHISQFRMWAYGDVWVVNPDQGDAVGGIYADDPDEALKQFVDEHPAEPTSDEVVVAGENDFVAPTASWEHVQRWSVDDGTVVADTGSRKPGVHFYPRSEDDRLLADPAGLVDALRAAIRVVDDRLGADTATDTEQEDQR